MPSVTSKSSTDSDVGKADVQMNVEPRQTIYSKLAEAQAEIGNVAKNALNPHFKSKFVDLAQLTDAVIPVLNKRGLFLSQRVVMMNSYEKDQITATPVLITQIFDDMGESLPTSEYPIISKDNTDPQKFGAGLTYARRYALMSYLGIAAEDDDGNTAAAPKPSPAKELGELLKKSGVNSKEEFAKKLRERYNDDRTALSQLKPEEIKAWVAELKTKEQVPF